MSRLVFVVAAVCALVGCAGVKTKTQFVGGKPAAVTSRTGPVCMLAGALPDGVTYAEIGRVKATKGTYGERENLMLPMANEARRVGADAIIYLQTGIYFKAPIPWRVAAPTGDGVAVKLGADDFDCAGHGGRLL